MSPDLTARCRIATLALLTLVVATAPLAGVTAGAGVSPAATADDDGGPTREAPSTARPGETLTVTVETTATSGTLTVEESFDPDVAAADIERVTVDGERASPLVAAADGTGAVVTLGGLDSGATVVVEYTLTVPGGATAGETIRIDGSVTSSEREASIEPATVTVRVNRPPTADAGPDRTAESGTTVRLDGSGTTDPDGDDLTYEWTQTAGPDVDLSDRTAARPTLTAPSVSTRTTLDFTLSVADGRGGTDTDTVAVVVTPPPDAPEASRSLAASAAPGETVTVTLLTIATAETLSVDETFDPAVADTSVRRVTVAGTTVSPTVGHSDGNRLALTVENTSAGTPVTVEYTLTVPADASDGSRVDVTGRVTSGGTTVVGPDTLAVSAEESLEGPAGDYDRDDDGSISLSELAVAAEDYAAGEIALSELATVADVYAAG